ncbi:small subunit processome component 20 [Diplogelasinospora grovesii]|uniref:Small subunit processome component 20 n=1 Tax=Diplogelasinospora grovesii TaxID=303347 RepID=A0AAN6S5E4_9PEZI|nr:small subunit processome component 20 [Diplogelasinospora grovesii]
MPSTTSGRIVKAQRHKKNTGRPKNHRWESFTTKISKLHSLDPLRKVRRHDLEAEDLSATTSYLRNGLDRWAELNASRPYAAFQREVLPLTDSLAQILHHEDRIMGSLADYIARHDKESLEALLDLLTAFAHDLGVRFEKHYPKALSLIMGIASSMNDVEVLEWTFAALAFLFKYLARLLVSDLRPTYDAVATLMGSATSNKKLPGHIARFAAEAMSFLVKKAAAPSNKEKALPLIIEHARASLESAAGSRNFDLYSQGIMTMFAEAIKGTGQTLHSTGPDILAALIRAVPEDELELKKEQMPWADVCDGVLASIIHHATMETFRPIETRLIEEAGAAPQSSILFIRLFGAMAGVRRGNRIHDWPTLVKVFGQLLGYLATCKEKVETAPGPQIWQNIVVNAAIVWAQAPIDALIPSLSAFNQSMTREPLMKWYIPFCSYLSDLDAERFRSLFQKDFQRFIIAHWSEGANEDLLCVLLPRMVETGGLPSPREKDACPLPQSWQDQIVSKFVRLEDTPFPESGGFGKDPETWRDKCLPKYSARLRVLESTLVHPSTDARIAEVLLKKLKLALRPSSSMLTDEANFILSDGFRAYLRMCAASKSVDPSLAPLLRAAAPRFCRSPAFLDALLTYYKEIGSLTNSPSQSNGGGDSPQQEEDPLVKALIENLTSPSHELRSPSLRILEVLKETPDQNSALETMLQAEELPYDAQSVRAIAVHLRKLGHVFSHIDENSWLMQAIPSFLFGMLTVPLSPIWDDAVAALKQIAQGKKGEEIIADLAFHWLEVPSPSWAGLPKPTDTARKQITDFECLNHSRLLRTAVATGQIVQEYAQNMSDKFEQGQTIIELRSENARGKALKVFTAVPGLAERRSRKFVPYLLKWSSETANPDEGAEDDEEDEEAEDEGSWSLADRKALIGVFAQFNNPRVLYQSQRVYDALLGVLANGDIELQKLALKAILAWKHDGIKPYREHLEFLLDEARFKNELTVFFQGDNKIQPAHREDLMPVLLRLLYGRAISKKGAASGRQGLHATRLAIIRQLDVDDMGAFLAIALGELRAIRVVDDAGLRESLFANELLPVRKQIGLLNMTEAVINELGTAVLPYMELLANAVLYCLIYACRQLRESPSKAEDAEEKEEDDEEEEEGAPIQNASLLKVIRTTALKCLCKLFQHAQTFDWTPYQEAMVAEVISPGIEKLSVETTQGVSGTWRLMGTWAALPKTALLLAIDRRILPNIVACLGLLKTKDEVKLYALDILKSLSNLAQASAAESEFNELIRAELLDPNIDLILKEIGGLLRDQGDISRDLLSTAVETVVELAPVVEASKTVQDMIDIAAFLLNQPSRKVNPKVKGSILLILKRFIVLQDLKDNAELQDKVYATLSSLFAFFKDKQNRETLAEVLLVFASQAPWAQEVADICRDLNSYVPRRLDEPDYNKRLAAFNSVTRERDVPFTIDQWMPLLYNFLYSIQKDEEFGVLSSNSADGICKFIEVAESAWADEQQRSAYVGVLSGVVMPAIYSGAREASETVRREILRVFGHLVGHLRSWEPVADLSPLVPLDDVESSEKAFFFHIMSPAISRQLQALRVLEKANEKHELNSKHISQFFIPLLEHFIFGRPDEGDDQGLSAQATNTIAALTASLEWQQYRAMLRRFVSYVESKPDWKKRVIRLLEKEVDALRSAIDQKKLKSEDAMDVDVDEDEAKPTVDMNARRLTKTLPSEEKVSAEIVDNFLPTLLKYIHDKDETTVSARVPVGVIIAKLLMLLPEQQLGEKLPGVLTDICHILRSKSWEAREMARDTLSKITGVLGPDRFEFILKELRGALTKGYQLHVLSYTLHSILLVAIPSFEQGALDYCLPSIVAVIMDDIFGVTGQEKDADDYSSSTKEVKSSKSQDSMELIAKSASIKRLGDLTLPLQQFLMEKLDVRTVRKVDELLTRIAKGLLENPAAASQDVLVFCYEVVQEVYNSQKPEKEQPKMDPRLKRYLVQKHAKKSDGGATSKHTYKLIRFALDILRAVMKKHDDLRTAANISGFLPIIGDAVLSAEEEVKIAAFKLLNALVKVPFTSGAVGDSTGLYKVATKEAIKAISMSPSTTSELSQAALKMVSVALRDRREIPIKDAAIDVLLGKLKDDLTEPLHRHVTFNFLRSVLDRKIETAVVYDTLDHVGTVMITNDDKDTRDLARGAFFQFLRDYPQKKNRWQKQLTFIVANLKYERESGRLSVMEVIHLLLRKSADDFVQEVAATCFIPLIFVLANDDSEKCRAAAGELLKEVFRVADRERLQKFLVLSRSWLGQDDNPAVLKLALQAFGLYFEGREPDAQKDRKDLNAVTKKITEVLRDEQDEWELVKDGLATTQTLVEKHPQKLLSKDAEGLWSEVRGCLSKRDQNPTVQLTSIRLLSMYLADFASNSNASKPPLTGSYGLELGASDVAELVRLSLGILSGRAEISEALAGEAVKILLFLGRYLPATRPSSAPSAAADNASDVSDGEEDAEDEQDEEDTVEKRTADMGYLFWKLTHIIRREVQAKFEMLVPKVAAMDLLEAFCNTVPAETLAPSVKIILRPLRNLTDPSIPGPFSLNPTFKERYDGLKEKAQMIMEALQRKLGSQEYTKALLAVGEDIRQRRVERSSKRKIEAVTNPERYGAEKRKKFEKKKVKRKEKGRESRDLRQGYR